MRAISRKRPSPAIVVAVVALVAGLAGTAVADPGASTSAVTKKKVKKIANKQINKRLPWETGDLADNAVTTPKLANGAVTGPKLATIETRARSESVADGAYFEGEVNCQSNEKVVSGGVKWANPALASFTPVIESYKQGEGWFARVFNGSGLGAQTVTIEAYCLAA
jgi:hypothetical protein